MMNTLTKTEILERISCGEDSFTQFKESKIGNNDLSKELVAFSNLEGGIIFWGVADNGEIKGLPQIEIEKLGQEISNISQNNIRPSIITQTQNIKIEEKIISVVFISKGENKPYSTNKGDYYIKSGPDKKKVPQEQLRRLFQESKNLFADEEPVRGTDITDLNQQLFDKFLESYDEKLYKKFKKKELNIKTLLQNFDIMNGDHLTLSGNLIFGIDPQKFNKSFYIDCCYFDGDDISVNKYISEIRIDGDFETLYNNGTDFIKSNVRNRQVEKNFNSNGVPEISHEVIGELVTNALIHRDYYINSPIEIFMFHDRVEIISPGKLFNSLTIEKIKLGNAIRRNQTLDRICNKVLTYTGRGSGIKRVLEINPNVEFINDKEKEEFKCIIPRN